MYLGFRRNPELCTGKGISMTVQERYESARDIYKKYGVDTENAIERLGKIS